MEPVAYVNVYTQLHMARNPRPCRHCGKRSAAIRSTAPEFIPRIIARLSPWNNFRFFQFASDTSRSPSKPIVQEMLPCHTNDDLVHLVDGIHVTNVVTSGKLSNVPMQMFRTYIVKCTVVSTLQQGPRALHTVGVCLIRTYSLTRYIMRSCVLGVPTWDDASSM